MFYEAHSFFLFAIKKQTNKQSFLHGISGLTQV